MVGSYFSLSFWTHGLFQRKFSRVRLSSLTIKWDKVLGFSNPLKIPEGSMTKATALQRQGKVGPHCSGSSLSRLGSEGGSVSLGLIIRLYRHERAAWKLSSLQCHPSERPECSENIFSAVTKPPPPPRESRWRLSAHTHFPADPLLRLASHTFQFPSLQSSPG